MNTGSPEAPTEEALRVYLKAFLMDPHVIDLPWPLRMLLVHGLILPRRPAKSAEAYRKIWTANGSPLVHLCKRLAAGLNVEVGMAYGHPSFRDAVERLLATGVEEVCLLPLFPHYARATTGSCIASVKAAIRNRAALRVAPPFYNDTSFIEPLAASLAGADEHILFSFHGLPQRHLRKDARTAGYRDQCMETARLTAAAAGIQPARYSVAFQSRLGRTKWIEPHTNEMLSELPAKGVKQLAVICPSFFCDCLETLEEIGIRSKEIFLEAGGESFRLIPCLNDSPAALRCMETLMANAGNWPHPD